MLSIEKKMAIKDKRMILSLKNFNKFVNHIHFKLEYIDNVINLIKSNACMVSIDLKDAFFFSAYVIFQTTR